MQERINKEKEFHNTRFDKEIRTSLGKFYSVGYIINDYYQNNLYNASSGKYILEFGCGLGNQSFELTNYASEVTAIDISDVAINKARNYAKEKGVNNIRFDVMNAEELDFPDNYFDVVCGISILHHLDLKSAYSEISRVLKPDGQAYFIEPLGHNPVINEFRRLTYSLRTEDEHPLLRRDLLLINEYFGKLNIRFYYLSSLLSVPFYKTKYFSEILNFFNSIDQFLFRFNFLKYQAWQVVIEMSEPKK